MDCFTSDSGEGVVMTSVFFKIGVCFLLVVDGIKSLTFSPSSQIGIS